MGVWVLLRTPKRLICDFALDLFVTSSRFRAVSGSMLFKRRKEASARVSRELMKREKTHYIVPLSSKKTRVASRTSRSAFLVSALSRSAD